MQIFCYKDIQANSIDQLLDRISTRAADQSGFAKEKILNDLSERERLSPTAIGRGVMLPHIRIDGISNDYLFLFVLKDGIQYNSPDNTEIRLVFLIISPLEKKSEYLKLVSSIVKMIKTDSIYKQISETSEPEEIKKILINHLLSKGN